MGNLTEFELRSVPILNSAWTHGGSQCCGGLCRSRGQILMQQHRPQCRMAPALDLEIRGIVTLDDPRNASFVFSAGFEGWIVGQLPTAIPIIHWPRHGILRNVNDSGGIQHLGSKGLKESVSCICEQAINPAVCRSDFQLVPPMWSRAALARVANCWCPRVMWCCPEDGASISRPISANSPPCPAMGGPACPVSARRRLTPVKVSQSNRKISQSNRSN